MNHSHKDMRKYIYMLAALLAMTSCNKSGLEIKSGNVVGEINVTAASGSLSVSVETVGRWLVYEADAADWVSLDVPCHIRQICRMLHRLRHPERQESL